MRVAGLCTDAAADAIPHMANVGFFSLERELVLLDEVLLVNPVVEEIPRKVLLQPFGPVDKKIRIDLIIKADF